MNAWKKLCCVLVAAFALLIFQQNQGQAAPDPVGQLKPVVARITTMLTTAEYKSLSREAQFTRFFSLASERFDFDEMSKRVLGPQWNSLSVEQKRLFNDRFTRLLGYTYMDKIDTYNGEPIQYGAPRQRGNRVEVPTFIQFSDGKSVAISYIMQLKGNEWQAYDIVAEKISLVKNYAEQLRSIMQKQGFDGLIREMNEKITQMQAKSGR